MSIPPAIFGAAGLAASLVLPHASDWKPPAAVPATQEDYWYQGKAEISRFHLEQSRYGETRTGHAIQVFVTEDFLPDKQVKLESGTREQRQALSVLKLNGIRRFTTGIYDYSMMRSVFTPVDIARHPRTLKSTTSVQEWCGQVWLQWNLRGGQYVATGHSYFEQEADQTSRVAADWTEDGLWTLIRLAPDRLPKGKVRMIPGGFDLRLRHQPLRAADAVVSHEDADTGQRRVRVDYPKLGRVLSITYDTAFPHRIHSFSEELQTSRGAQRTHGRRTHQVFTDYWNQKSRKHDAMRASLGL